MSGKDNLVAVQGRGEIRTYVHLYNVWWKFLSWFCLPLYFWTSLRKSSGFHTSSNNPSKRLWKKIYICKQFAPQTHHRVHLILETLRRMYRVLKKNVPLTHKNFPVPLVKKEPHNWIEPNKTSICRGLFQGIKERFMGHPIICSDAYNGSITSRTDRVTRDLKSGES